MNTEQQAEKLSIFYMVEPGRLEWQAICLAASLLSLCTDHYTLVAYCSKHKFSALRDKTIKFHESYNIPIILIETDGIFMGNYNVGSKVVASSVSRSGTHAVFLDTDTALVNNMSFSDLIRPNAVLAMPSVTRLLKFSDEDWKYVYGKFGLPIPHTRYRFDYLGRESELELPYFNAGVVIFPEERFGKIWLDLTKSIELDDKVPSKSPWLDQISLPVAIQKSGLAAIPLDRIYNFPVEEPGKEIRADAKIIHYHFGANLLHCSKSNILNQLLRNLTEFSGLEDLFLKYENVGYERR